MTPGRRRTVLRSIAASTVPLAGCLGRGGRSSTDAPSTAAATDTPPPSADADTPTPPSPTAGTDTPFSSSDGPLAVGDACRAPDGRTVTVGGVRVSKLVRTTSVGDVAHVDVACLDGQQFAVVDAGVSNPDGGVGLTDVQFAFEVDGVRYPLATNQWYWAFPPGSNDRPGRPAFPVPVSDAKEAAVVWLRDGEPVVRWRLPDRTVEALGAAPSFAVRSFETPDSASRGSTVEAAFTVANTGDRDGRFVAEFGAGPAPDHDEVTVEVPSGAERTYAGTLAPRYGEDADDVEVTLDWGCGQRSRRVTVTD